MAHPQYTVLLSGLLFSNRKVGAEKKITTLRWSRAIIFRASTEHLTTTVVIIKIPVNVDKSLSNQININKHCSCCNFNVDYVKFSDL